MLSVITKWRWAIHGSIFILLCVFEYMEAGPGEPIHVIELAIYLTLIVLVGVLLDNVLRAMRKQEQVMALLEYKHKLSLALNTYTEWDELAEKLTKFPVEFAEVEQSCLLLANPISQRFEPVSYWRASDEILRDIVLETACIECLKQQSGQPTFRNCPIPGEVVRDNYYCLPIRDNQKVLALLQFRLKTGTKLSAQQTDILKHINDEMSVAIIAGQDRSRLAEMQISEATLAERRTVTNLLHDNLGQNISYLRLKIDQLSREHNLQTEEARLTLTQMLSVANDSYEIVRGTLEAMHQDTMPLLDNLLHEHARKIAQRANFALTFSSDGRPLPIKSETQKAIFYIFQEIFSNVEKHAQATQVSVFIGWAFDTLTVSIHDNGVGFQAEGIDPKKHFGLEIMRERVSALSGNIEFKSGLGEGTVVTFFVSNLSDCVKR